MTVQSVKELARAVRSHALRMTHKANASHIGGCFSMADILAVLYGDVLRVDPKQPDWPDRDRLVVSKGHAAAAVYTVLAERGFFPVEWLSEYCRSGSLLTGHVNHHVPGVEVSTGSLGHGLPIACGMALVAKRERLPWRVFALLSDGELDEGSNWEAILFAGHHGLDNLTVVVDYNKIQSFGRVRDVLELEPLADKFRAFRWAALETDGHNTELLHSILKSVPIEVGKPSLLIAHTVKGKGVSFMEDQLAWHYKSVTVDQLAEALAEVDRQ